ncbi:type II toxin-antitoxin system Phd/YefM family antitoxin [Anaerococcus urinomassiliensis]|uniref:type II toxin-antitoxin system Phd/YefM family antitoxin n=1 Tax=Anaerococcus urinomassiliensis TaxID=1745712 RepID=UPI00093DCB16|nr:type II toxin-antitoxin system Phd/YefM family antitoxin [Anaerococcus urinomassiliensis]
MKIDTKTMVSITEANQNFSKVARLVDEKGSAVILKNNAPKYVITAYEESENIEDADDELVMDISKSLIEKNKEVYKKLSE